MPSLQDIKTAIEQLSREDRAALLRWLDERENEAWDAQIRADIDAGRFDTILQKIASQRREGSFDGRDA